MSTQNHPIDNPIFDAAQSLLNDVGEAFTIAQLEAKANVSRATIYRRIGNKEMLLKRLVQERGETFERLDIRLSILEAAGVIFGREGLAAATMTQIASEAKVSVATVYRHFGDKKRLVYAFIEELTPRTALCALALHPSEDVSADLKKIVGTVLPFFFENRDVLRLVFMGSETERYYFERLRKSTDSILEHLANYFRAQLDAGRLQSVCEAGELALALMSMVFTFAVVGPLHYGAKLKHLERSGNLIITLFLNDLRGNQL